jgi:hypothetical protein
MKNLILLFLLVGSLSQARVAKETCGLPATTSDEGITEEKNSISLKLASNQKLAVLPLLSKAQLIKAAFLDQNLPVNETQLRRAVAALREASEGGDLYLTNLTYRGRRFTYVQLFPGGNEGGVIFSYGSAVPLAEVGDQDIECLRPQKF